MKRLTLVAAFAALSLPAFARAATYDIDPVHSTVSFKVKHLMVSWVRGSFKKFSGTIDYDAKNPGATALAASIDASSIDTGNGDRDGHLKSPDFFDVAKFPTLDFKATKVKPAGKNKFTVTGDLTMHGVTKPVSLVVEGLGTEVTDPWGNVKIGASGTAKLNRKEFGLSWSKALEAGGVVVGDDVEIVLDIEAVKHKADTSAK
jgi:polyisoprenoid-binding protein YceI